MFVPRNDHRPSRNYALPSTKLRNIFCTHCKHQFFVRDFIPLHGLVPLLLECGHVICDKCWRINYNKPCPLCNTISHQDGQRAKLPVNMYLLGLTVVSHNRPEGLDDSDISFSRSIKSKMKQQCMQGLCHECGIQATIKCPQCAALYCHMCYAKIHGKALQSHSKIILSEGNTAESTIVRNTCSERCTESLGYYCENCEIAGCSHCMLRLHQKHNYTPLRNKNQQLLPEFYTATDRITENLQRVRLAQKKLKSSSMYPSNQQNTDSVEAAVTQHFAHLHGVLQNVEQKIMQSLHDYRESRNKDVDEISSRLKDLEDQLQTALLVTASVTENVDKVDVQQVVQKLQKLIDIPCHLIRHAAPNDEKLRFEVDNSIVESLANHCSVQIPSVSSFSLERKQFLPNDYEIEPLTEEINIPTLKDKSPTMTRTTSNVSLASEKVDTHLTVGSSEMVRVTHVVDPSCFFVQLVQNQTKITELGKQLSFLASIAEFGPTEITLNALYAVQSSRDRVWYRARITDKIVDSKNQRKYTAFFIDCGVIEANVPLCRIKNIVTQYAMLPVMALKCSLFDIVPNDGKWHPDAIQAFEKLVCTNIMVSMCIMMITGDTYYVDLCVISSKDSGLISVKESLRYMKYATCVSPNKLMRLNPDSTKKYYKEVLEIEVYTEVQVLFVESPSSIYVQKSHGNRSYFHKLVREMTEDYEQNLSTSGFIHVPCKEMPCAARGVDGYWYRGIICEVTETAVKVFYVDLGYTLILNHDAIRALSKKYMSSRTQAIRVSLRNIKPMSGKDNQWAADTIEYLKKFLMDMKNLKIIPFDKFRDTYSVAMYTYDKTSISYLLIKKGLALNAGSSPRSANTNNKHKKKKMKLQKNTNTVEEATTSNAIQAVPYDGDVSVKSQGTVEETEDPFKVPVLVHQVLSPDCIYVSDGVCDQSDIERMMAQMQEFYSIYRSARRETWSNDSVCAVYCSTNDAYYRGRIVDIKSTEKVVVFLYDMGIEKTVTMKDIQSLYPQFFKIPTYVFKIKLTGILPCGGSKTWPSLSCEVLQEIIDKNQYCKFYVSKLQEEDIEDTAIPVELWIKQIKMDGPLSPTRIEITSINRMLVEKGVALPLKEYARKRDKILAVELKRQLMKKLERLSKCESNIKWFKIDEDADRSVDISDNNEMSKTLLHSTDSENEERSIEEIFDVIPTLSKLSTWLPADSITEDSFIAIPTYLDDDGFLYIHSKEQNEETLKYIESKLEEVYKDVTIEMCDTVWVAGDMCIAQYHANKKWYRAKVLKVLDNDTIEAEFVDYGNIEECSIGMLKKKVILENIPIQCTKCLIYGLNTANENGKWITEDLDKIHSVVVDQECNVTILDRTESYPVISLTIVPNKNCNKKVDLITFLVNNLGIDINHEVNDNESFVHEKSNITSDSADVIIESTKSFTINSDDEVIQDAVISGYSVLLQNKDDSCGTIEIENLSWCKASNDMITSTPNVVSEENLLMNYKVIDVPSDVEYIEIELCCSINATEFYAQLKENTHSTILNAWYTQYKLLMVEIQENASNQPMITSFSINTPCCAKFSDGIWYRCLIIESEPIKNTNDVEVKLLYVDYGNDEYRIINIQQCELYALKKEWMDLPAMSIKCKLWNVEIIPTAGYESLLSQLEKMYNKLVIATVKEVDEEFMNVELYANNKCTKLLYSTLIEEGLFRVKSKID